MELFDIIVGIPFALLVLFSIVGIIAESRPPSKKAKQNEIARLKEQLDTKDRELTAKEEELSAIKRQHECELSQLRSDFQKEVQKEKENLQKQYREARQTLSNATSAEISAQSIRISELNAIVKKLREENTRLSAELGQLHEDEFTYTITAEQRQHILDQIEFEKETTKNLEYWKKMSTEIATAARKGLPLSLMNKTLVNQYMAAMRTMSLPRALSQELYVELPFQISANVRSFTDKKTVYHTTLEYCSCLAFEPGHPCKHMIALAIKLRAFTAFEAHILRLLERVSDDVVQAEEARKTAAADRKKAGQYKQDCITIEKFIKEKSISYPWLSDLISRYQMEAYTTRQKKSSAQRKAEREIKKLKKENAALSHQLLVYQTTFPFLKNTDALSPDEFISLVAQNPPKNKSPSPQE